MSDTIDPDAIDPGADRGFRQLRWRCRRGMRELDRMLEGFVDDRYASLSDSERRRFAEILELPDPELRAYLMGKAEPQDAELARLFRTIRQTASIQA